MTERKEPPRADSLLALQRILGLLDPRFVQHEVPSEQIQKVFGIPSKGALLLMGVDCVSGLVLLSLLRINIRLI